MCPRVMEHSAWLYSSGKTADSEVPIYFIAEWQLFKRDTLYGYWDDVYRFAFFQLCRLELTQFINWRSDVLHAHDWHTAPAVTWWPPPGKLTNVFAAYPVFSPSTIWRIRGKANWHIMHYLGDYYPLAQRRTVWRGEFHGAVSTTQTHHHRQPDLCAKFKTPSGGAGLTDYCVTVLITGYGTSSTA